MGTPDNSNWIYIIVQNPGASYEEIVGYEHPETNIPFIPAFNSKETAQACFILMPKDIMNEKFEAQAMIKEDLISHAREKGFTIYMLDDKGTILSEIN